MCCFVFAYVYAIIKGISLNDWVMLFFATGIIALIWWIAFRFPVSVQYEKEDSEANQPPS